MKVKTGILLVGFGGPRSLSEVAPMLERVMGTTPPPPLVAASQKKYELIGGKSPQVEIAENIAEELLARWQQITEFNRIEWGEYVQHCEIGMCFTEPFLEDSVARLAETGCEQIIYLSMTAFESSVAWIQPFRRTQEAAEKVGIPKSKVVAAPVFGNSLPYMQAHMQQVATATECAEGGTELVFVAHSLPLDNEDEITARYEQQLIEACGYIAHILETNYGLTYVSAGARGGQWLEPNLSGYMKDLAEKLRRPPGTTVVVCPLGFATDHMEVLYDLDIAAAKDAQELGFNFVRTPTLATTGEVHPALITALVDSVFAALSEGSAL